VPEGSPFGLLVDPSWALSSSKNACPPEQHDATSPFERGRSLGDTDKPKFTFRSVVGGGAIVDVDVVAASPTTRHTRAPSTS